VICVGRRAAGKGNLTLTQTCYGVGLIEADMSTRTTQSGGRPKWSRYDGIHDPAAAAAFDVELTEKISATVTRETVILGISVTDPNPQQAQALAQAVAEELTEFVSELETPPGRANAPIKASIVDAASLPDAPVSPQPIRNLGLAAVLGLLLGLGAAVLRELLDTTVKTHDDIEEIARTAVMGNIAFDPEAPKSPLITSLGTHAPRVEAFRVLRTNLQFVNVDSDSKVFVVTSSLPEEGKTTTATNLAITLAQAGQRVLLVEADLRRPKISTNLKLETAVGLELARGDRLQALLTVSGRRRLDR
jgi:hypothetical protein